MTLRRSAFPSPSISPTNARSPPGEAKGWRAWPGRSPDGPAGATKTGDDAPAEAMPPPCCAVCVTMISEADMPAPDGRCRRGAPVAAAETPGPRAASGFARRRPRTSPSRRRAAGCAARRRATDSPSACRSRRGRGAQSPVEVAGGERGDGGRARAAGHGGGDDRVARAVHDVVRAVGDPEGVESPVAGTFSTSAVPSCVQSITTAGGEDTVGHQAGELHRGGAQSRCPAAGGPSYSGPWCSKAGFCRTITSSLPSWLKSPMRTADPAGKAWVSSVVGTAGPNVPLPRLIWVCSVAPPPQADQDRDDVRPAVAVEVGRQDGRVGVELHVARQRRRQDRPAKSLAVVRHDQRNWRGRRRSCASATRSPAPLPSTSAMTVVSFPFVAAAPAL